MCKSISRVLLVIVSLLLMIAAAIILYIGVTGVQSNNQEELNLINLFPSLSMQTVYTILTSLGGVIGLAALFGFLGGILQKNGLLKSFLFITGLSLIIDLGLGGYVLYKLLDSKEYFLNMTEEEYGKQGTQSNMAIQTAFQCCGWETSENIVYSNTATVVIGNNNFSANPCTSNVVAASYVKCKGPVTNVFQNLLLYDGIVWGASLGFLIVLLVLGSTSLKKSRS